MRSNWYLIWILISFMFISCKSEYEKAVDNELATGMVNDSLIFGMRMGQTKKEFFAMCWELNRQKLIAQGTGNRTAKYIEPLDSTETNPSRKEMLFYGIFDEQDTMRGMDMTFTYSAWAPWNKERYSIPLMEALKAEYMEHYGPNPFIEINLGDIKYKAFVKIDGNRQILIYPKNDKDVVVKMEDLRYRLRQKDKNAG
jgi:hypothetical protein